jgi:hypothetical protein
VGQALNVMAQIVVMEVRLKLMGEERRSSGVRMPRNYPFNLYFLSGRS